MRAFVVAGCPGLPRGRVRLLHTAPDPEQVPDASSLDGWRNLPVGTSRRFSLSTNRRRSRAARPEDLVDSALANSPFASPVLVFNHELTYSVSSTVRDSEPVAETSREATGRGLMEATSPLVERFVKSRLAHRAASVTRMHSGGADQRCDPSVPIPHHLAAQWAVVCARARGHLVTSRSSLLGSPTQAWRRHP